MMMLFMLITNLLFLAISSSESIIECEESKSHQPQSLLVNLTETTHKLYYVADIYDVDDGPVSGEEEVPSWQLENNVGIRVKVMAEGGNMIQLSKQNEDGEYVDYIWNNNEIDPETGDPLTGAVYYGPDTNAFPLQRGLILHGGVRFAVVSAEHGLYYDIDWDMTFAATQDSRSIILSITDSEENRQRVLNKSSELQPEISKYPNFSKGQFNLDGDYEGYLSQYPVTNMKFVYTITLKQDEEFVRLNMKVVNPTDTNARAEAWLPMTYPIDQDSQIISKQAFRWKRDSWFNKERANIQKFTGHNELLHPLWWNSSGIYYDWPSMDGAYHAVNLPSSNGRGVAYVVDPNALHFIKLWSWGDKANFNRPTADALAAGRPKTEYYEPWGSAFNFGFFQRATFPKHTINEWNAVILPIESGLDAKLENEALQKRVEQEIESKGVYVNSASTMYPGPCMNS